MTKTELLALINLGEGLNIEFKENFSASVGKEICAFANTIGGNILFGVDDNGNVQGWDRDFKDERCHERIRVERAYN
ncbi:MAG TPA: ATP-binding protein, partial [Candidatus Deferrimicrobium sp.]|nr:ATP-binding protein [Candidatus Deferrimicrobium sp.]